MSSTGRTRDVSRAVQLLIDINVLKTAAMTQCSKPPVVGSWPEGKGKAGRQRVR